jgi:hypothetical protein
VLESASETNPQEVSRMLAELSYISPRIALYELCVGGRCSTEGGKAKVKKAIQHRVVILLQEL